MISYSVRPGDRPELIQTKRLFTAAVWVSLATSLLSVYQLWTFDARWAALAVSLPLFTAVIALTAMWVNSRSFPGVMHVVALGTLVTTTAMIIVLGGIYESAGNTAWAVLVVIAAVAIFADKRAHFWLVAFIVTTVAAFLITQQIGPIEVLPNREYLALFNLIVVTVFIYFVMYYFVKRSAQRYRETDRLLRNILPDEVVERLKKSEDMIADEYDSASILFADVAGFTAMSAELEPAEMIGLLNDIFTAFDELVAAGGLEKIKTIGDAYMVSSGVPVPRENHARAICDLALDMQEHLNSAAPGIGAIQMRIGIASGPVIAGIIGRKKFSYDLWGDTVNVASRMETSGVPGRIQVTSSTQALAADWFEFEERGLVEIRGKGEMRTWYLSGRSSSL
jgi:adenylate cyclase